MANPQKENGHTALANEIWDALAKYRLSGEEWKCLIVIIRKTYGWNKKSDCIALSQFYKYTDMKKPSIIRAIKKLIIKNIIIVSYKANAIATEYRFNKDFDKWKLLAKKLTLAKKLISVSQKANLSLAKKLPTKETTTKETIQKKKDIDIFSDHVLQVLKINMSDKKQTENLLKIYGLDLMLSAVNRMKVYFDACKQYRWTQYVISKYWRNLYEKIDFFISDKNFELKLESTRMANTPKEKEMTPLEKMARGAI